MSASTVLIALTGCSYAWIAGEQFIRGQFWLGVMWGGYAIAQVALWHITKAGVSQ
jgi:phage-related minor tail protein